MTDMNGKVNRTCLHWTEWEKRAKELEKENAELKEKCRQYENGYAYERLYELRVQAKSELDKAKELIENIIRVTWGEGWNYSLDWKVKAEQFLNEE